MFPARFYAKPKPRAAILRTQATPVSGRASCLGHAPPSCSVLVPKFPKGRSLPYCNEKPGGVRNRLSRAPMRSEVEAPETRCDSGALRRALVPALRAQKKRGRSQSPQLDHQDRIRASESLEDLLALVEDVSSSLTPDDVSATLNRAAELRRSAGRRRGRFRRARCRR